MNIHEHQAKKILKKYGAVVPKGIFSLNVEDLIEKAKNTENRKICIKSTDSCWGKRKSRRS